MKRATRQKIESDQIESVTHFSAYTRPLLRRIEQGKWDVTNKEDLVDLLQEVQIGNISCRRAADIIKNSS